VIDSRLETPPAAQVLAGGGTLMFAARAGEVPGAEVVVQPNDAGKVDLAAALMELGRRGINELLVEAGHKLNASLLAAGLVDELLIYQAPMLVGDRARGMFDLAELVDLAEARRLKVLERRQIGADMLIRARLA